MEKEIKPYEELKEIRIKLLTNDNMYYTFAIINKDTAEVVDFKEISEQESTSLERKIEIVAKRALDDLYGILKNEKFIYCRFEDKIINVNSIKESIIYKY